MEAKINIAEILRNKPSDIRLYSPIFSDCAFCYIQDETSDICVKKHNDVIEYFNSEGLYFALGEVMLFPSKSIRDWQKFAWKKGDVCIKREYVINPHGDTDYCTKGIESIGVKDGKFVLCEK